MNKTSQIKMPASIERAVRKQNIQYMHNKNQYSLEFFQFMRKLLTCNTAYVQPHQGQEKLVSSGQTWTLISCLPKPIEQFHQTESVCYPYIHSFSIDEFIFQTLESEELAMISVQLASRFLFNVGFHTKKTLRYSSSHVKPYNTSFPIRLIFYMY